jgi:quercetin dioxygenase-like cupin family protein
MLKLSKVHSDERGEINIIEGDLREEEEITLLSTKKGFARGGCIHRVHDEFFIIFEGVVKYFIGDNPPEIFKKGESGVIPKNTPHYLVSIEDSLMAEWGADPEEKKEKDKTSKEIVDEINKNNQQ